jgi:predicted porin
MNKKLIAVAVAAGLAAPLAAQADVTTYAKVQFEIANIDVDGSESTTTVTDRERGQFGMKGGYDLGGGLKSWAKAEFDFEGNNNDVEFGGHGNAFRVREVNVGLTGGFGSLGIGTVKSAYKYAGGVTYDPFVATTLEARGGDGMTAGAGGHHAFLSNALIYTNKFGMAKVHVTYSPDDTDRDSGTANDDAGEMSASLKFGAKDWEAGVAMYDEGVSVSTENLQNTKVFGKMNFGPHSVQLQYENSDSGATTNAETTYIWAGYTFKMGKGMLNAQYADVDPDGNNNNHTMMTLGYIYKFNKNTRVFAGYHNVDYDAANSDEDTISVGLRVDI